ncbi:cell envelope-related transcriptional attenuator [Caldalkalibacillus thermarum TA2.A1]|uniref:Cell envelope-related transcriptional attenuator n=1 Tax=Caldalkalibacillus thermarum (strain TA2.A1) TaxID=986075 RepID=F5L9A6_CALTT|nr:LCP family protein [Caldalkalibacillus thermarum]EGL82048.1 cell envelope-related transcriptional attenuator [Caldalkalibacillus thermarum TA2.A1]QZT34034.1 LCP family protein [Caldalkalibacillus thermarum TA2.A1]
MQKKGIITFIFLMIISLAWFIFFTKDMSWDQPDIEQKQHLSPRKESESQAGQPPSNQGTGGDQHQQELADRDKGQPELKPEPGGKKTPRTGPVQDRQRHVRGGRPFTEPFTVLLLGVDDRRGNFVGRSDVIILAVVRPQDPSVSLLSIPRDTYAPIAKRGTYEKINHAYAYGTDTALATLENFLDIPIDYYVAVNFKGFIQLIDLLGGIRLDVERDVSYQHRYDGNQALYVHKGEQVLSGEEALLYVRFRSDAEGDFGRNRRQQQVIRALVDQAVDMRNITKLADMMGIVVKHVRTNLPVLDMIRLVRQLSTLTSDQLETISVKADVGSIRGISYVFIDEGERLRLQQELKRRLE